jgi:putative transposase
MKQLEFEKVKGWGGRRKNAGRKNRTSTVNHMKRKKVEAKYPIHITIKLKKGVASLRGPRMVAAFKSSLRKAKKRGLKVIHYALESNHAHLFAESEDNRTLRSGMASFGSSFGKSVRRLAGGKGSVFNGRYHLQVLKSPRQTKNAMAYVLLNHSKHQGAKPYVDEKSSAVLFGDWRALLGDRYRIDESPPRPQYLSDAESWLGRVGWRRG